MAQLSIRDLFGIIVISMAMINPSQGLLNSTLEWKNIQDTKVRLSGRNIEFPCDSTEAIYRESSKFIPNNILISRMQIFLYDVIVAMPRYRSGVPITLGKIQLKCTGCCTAIKPFPDWSMQQEGNCNSLQSVVDIYLDSNNVLWVLDDGVTNSLESQPIKKCPPKIVAISMLTSKVLYNVDLSPFTLPDSTLQYIVAESAENGNDYVYISDAQTGAIIMYNLNLKTGKRLVFPPSLLKACPKSCALYLSIIMKSDLKNYLYFTYIDGPMIFSVETSTIREDGGLGAITVVGSKPDGSGIVFCGTDNLSNLYFRRRDENVMYTWDANTPWKKDQWLVVERGSLDRQATHVAPGPWKMIWMLESNVHDFVNQKTGCFGPSTILHPIAKNVNNAISLRLRSL